MCTLYNIIKCAMSLSAHSGILRFFLIREDTKIGCKVYTCLPPIHPKKMFVHDFHLLLKLIIY